MIMPKMILNAHTLFLIEHKNCNIILKTEQTTTVYAQCDRWTYDVMKYMITTDVLPPLSHQPLSES